MNNSKHIPIIAFCLVLAVFATVLGSRWSVAEAGYIDEPAGLIEGSSTGGTVNFGERGNGSADFTNCEGKCIVKDGLPLYAKDSLDDIDGTIIGKAYIRTVDGEGNLTFDSYTICFDSPGTLYQFVIGRGWVIVAFDDVPGADVCHTTSGEGVFVFAH